MSEAPSPPTSPKAIMSKAERRKEQNRRAQANLRKRRQENIGSLQQQINWLVAQYASRNVQQSDNQQPTSRALDQSNLQPAIDNTYLGLQDPTFVDAVADPLSLQDMCFENSSISCAGSVPAAGEQYTPSTLIHPIARALQPPPMMKGCCTFDALARNATFLNICPERFLSTHSESPFYVPCRTTIPSDLHLPPSLRPTYAQMSYPHQPWIDCVPMREFRSRVILAASHHPPLLDTLDLWYDVLSEGLCCNGAPEDFMAWSMSDDFAKRWQMLLTIDLHSLKAMCVASNPPLNEIDISDI